MNRTPFVLLLVALLGPASSAEAAWLAKLTPAEQTELRLSTKFFLEQVNTGKDSPGYGMIRDRWPGNANLASTASVGFGLAALVVAADAGWIDRKEAEVRVAGTFTTLEKMDRQFGFWYHFVDMRTSRPSPGSEVSSVDSMLLILGALAAGQYFSPALAARAEALAEGMNWLRFTNKVSQQVFMSWTDEPMFNGKWDFYAEGLGMYILGAGNTKTPLTGEEFYAFTRHRSSGGFINSWFGSLFTYQYSHAFIDFRGLKDKQGVDWWQNSVDASVSAQKFTGTDLWGYTASDSQHGYEGRYGSAPSGFNNDQHFVDGTLAPAGPLGSAMFVPELVARATDALAAVPGLSGTYGFADAFNPKSSPVWINPDVIGIDKGITVLSLANLASGVVWKAVMKSPTIQRGLKKVGLTAGGKK
ncbi:MAG: glucoamylase family protein [Spirochaetales bacterium]